MLHNESVNVWSHLIGVVIFLIFIMYTAITLGPSIDPEMHLKIMDQFNKIYHMADNITFCDGDEIHDFTNNIFKIYSDDVEKNELYCAANFEFTNHEDKDLKCFESEHKHRPSFIELAMQNENIRSIEENIEYLLDKAETYIYSLVNGMKKISLRIRCPEKLKGIIQQAKDMTYNLKQKVKGYMNSTNQETAENDHKERMISLESVSTRVYDIFHEMIENQASTEIPDITFSSYFDSPGEILHDVTRIPLYVHIFSAIV
jgi:hypothetical protein